MESVGRWRSLGQLRQPHGEWAGTSFTFNAENFLTAAGASVTTSFIYGVKPFKNVTVGWSSRHWPGAA